MTEPGEHIRGSPSTFYTLAPQALALFDRNDHYSERPWQRQYDRV